MYEVKIFITRSKAGRQLIVANQPFIKIYIEDDAGRLQRHEPTFFGGATKKSIQQYLDENNKKDKAPIKKRSKPRQE